MMLSENSVGSTSSGTQETISLPNGSSVKLNGNYIDENGGTYTGNLSVSMHYLNPEDENMTLQMPGMLYAADADNEERLLQTFGMLSIELRGENGEDLNIADGSNAEISAPIPQSLVNSAPATIPLWSFDETYGVWVEEGIATLIGEKYVGMVSHFSTWNYDVPFETTNLCIDINSINSNSITNTYNPLSNLYLTLSAEGYGNATGFTNEQGELCIPVPIGISLDLDVLHSGSCTFETVYSENIGSFNEDSSIEINIDAFPNQEYVSETILGSFVKCNGSPVTNGYVEINYGGENYIDIINDGNFEISMLRCANDEIFSFKGIDFEDDETIGPITFQFGDEINNIGEIPTCTSIKEFVNISINEYFIITEDISIPLNVFNNINTSCQFDTQLDSLGNLYINWNQCQTFNPPEFRLTTCQFTGEGNYPIVYPDGPCGFGNGSDNQIYFKIDYFGDEIPFQFFSGTINITSYGEVGKYIDFSISGRAFFTLSAIYDDVTIIGHVFRD